MNWDKRYITLGPVATLLGLAFKLYDPDHLLGDKVKLGITCALIPTDTKGITIGRRHFPMSSAFPNGPNQGKDVFIPKEWIIGGEKMVGQGWRMLVERLSVGRAISLPSTVMGGCKISCYATGAYARIRKQFNQPIGMFEGVQEALTRIAGRTYMMDAMRVFTVAAVDRGEKPALGSAMSKYHNTELGRMVVNDSMDVHGGKGICLGPSNYIGRKYQEGPIAITVEGANILTRSMIIFGQGAIRCHPFVLQEMEAAQDNNLAAFDKAIIGHLGFIISSKVRAGLLGFSHGLLAGAPKGPTRRYYQHLTRISSAFALVSDVAMLTVGAELKRKESLSARLGDVLSMLYMGSAVLKHFEDQGAHPEDMPIIDWVCQTILFKAQNQLDGVLKNLPNRFVASVLRCVVFPLGKLFSEPNDKLSSKVAALLLSPTSSRARLYQGTFVTPHENNAMGYMEEVLLKVIEAEPLEKRLGKAKKAGKIAGYTLDERVEAAVKEKVLSKAEAKIVLDAEKGRQKIIAVDDFDPDELI